MELSFILFLNVSFNMDYFVYETKKKLPQKKMIMCFFFSSFKKKKLITVSLHRNWVLQTTQQSFQKTMYDFLLEERNVFELLRRDQRWDPETAERPAPNSSFSWSWSGPQSQWWQLNLRFSFFLLSKIQKCFFPQIFLCAFIFFKTIGGWRSTSRKWTVSYIFLWFFFFFFEIRKKKKACKTFYESF